MTWCALTRAQCLAERKAASLYLYRSSASEERLEEVLSLLAIHDHDELLRRRARHVDGRLTWARLGQIAVDALAPRLLRDDSDAADLALELGARLEERDAAKHARVTIELRDGIQRIVGLARALKTTRALSKRDMPSEEDVRAMMSLHQRYHTLRRVYPSGTDEWIKNLVQTRVASVLQSSAHAFIKDLAARALAPWTPPPLPNDAKRPRVGERVEWSDDDDF